MTRPCSGTSWTGPGPRRPCVEGRLPRWTARPSRARGRRGRLRDRRAGDHRARRRNRDHRRSGRRHYSSTSSRPCSSRWRRTRTSSARRIPMRPPCRRSSSASSGRRLNRRPGGLDHGPGRWRRGPRSGDRRRIASGRCSIEQSFAHHPRPRVRRGDPPHGVLLPDHHGAEDVVADAAASRRGGESVPAREPALPGAPRDRRWLVVADPADDLRPPCVRRAEFSATSSRGGDRSASIAMLVLGWRCIGRRDAPGHEEGPRGRHGRSWRAEASHEARVARADPAPTRFLTAVVALTLIVLLFLVLGGILDALYIGSSTGPAPRAVGARDRLQRRQRGIVRPVADRAPRRTRCGRAGCRGATGLGVASSRRGPRRGRRARRRCGVRLRGAERAGARAAGAPDRGRRPLPSRRRGPVGERSSSGRRGRPSRSSGASTAPTTTCRGRSVGRPRDLARGVGRQPAGRAVWPRRVPGAPRHTRGRVADADGRRRSTRRCRASPRSPSEEAIPAPGRERTKRDLHRHHHVDVRGRRDRRRPVLRAAHDRTGRAVRGPEGGRRLVADARGRAQRCRPC